MGTSMADELCTVHNRQSHCSACVLEAENAELKRAIDVWKKEEEFWNEQTMEMGQENDKLRALLTEAADNIAYYDQFAKQELLPRIREALKENR